MGDEDRFMRLAIEEARKGIAAGQTPFGACLVRGGGVVAVGHNRVWADTDITAHAEVVAIRRACRELAAIDLSGCVIYSTTEPCPMCFSACHWARVDRIVYGADIADARAAGFNELAVCDADLKRLGGSRVEITAGYLRDECLDLFRQWQANSARRAY
ncbi:MAG TPA: nucleoside deaminase [Tepidisphaeraceae bacterium]|nr:nucleoside deaminase [Tepidisphaeraceae bacterium]